MKHKRMRRIAIATAGLLAVPVLAFAAWIVTATITSINITGTAASATVTGQTCTKTATDNVRPGDTLAKCSFKTSGNVTGLNSPDKFNASVTGTNVVAGPITYQSSGDTMIVEVKTGTTGENPVLSTATLNFTG